MLLLVCLLKCAELLGKDNVASIGILQDRTYVCGHLQVVWEMPTLVQHTGIETGAAVILLTSRKLSVVMRRASACKAWTLLSLRSSWHRQVQTRKRKQLYLPLHGLMLSAVPAPAHELATQQHPQPCCCSVDRPALLRDKKHRLKSTAQISVSIVPNVLSR
jgi:hypothetical protein